VSPNCVLGTIGEPSTRRGALALFCGVPTHGRKDIEFQSFYELKILKITLTFILVVTMAHVTLYL